MRSLTITLLTLTLALPACRKAEDYSQNTPARTDAATQNSQAVPENSTAQNPITQPQQDMASRHAPPSATTPVDVQLLEYSIRMPAMLPAGNTIFRIENAGKENHGFVIEGNGVSVSLPESLPRGNRSELTIDLKPGSYAVKCPVDGHAGKGMKTTLTVQ